jgi:hypothetical protein
VIDSALSSASKASMARAQTANPRREDHVVQCQGLIGADP